MSARVDVLASARAELGEGPAWDAARSRLLWVDLFAGTVHATDLSTGRTETTVSPAGVTAVVPTVDGQLAVAARRGFGFLSADGHVELAADVGHDDGLRFNDGKCDALGRFWAGTMADDQRAGAGTLYRWAQGSTPVPVLRDVTVSNGLAWSRDGDTLYFIDTPKQRVDAYRVADDGLLVDGRVHADLTGSPGVPDGMTIDDDGCLWIAMCFGACLLRVSPSGAVAGRIDLPVDLPTSVCFVGPRLDRLAITTATATLTGQQLADQPLAGSVLQIDPGITGASTHPLA